MAKEIKKLDELTKVELESVSSGYSKNFPIKSATKMVADNSDWKLPKNSQFTFDSENGIRLKSDKGATEKS